MNWGDVRPRSRWKSKLPPHQRAGAPSVEACAGFVPCLCASPRGDHCLRCGGRLSAHFDPPPPEAA